MRKNQIYSIQNGESPSVERMWETEKAGYGSNELNWSVFTCVVNGLHGKSDKKMKGIWVVLSDQGKWRRKNGRVNAN